MVWSLATEPKTYRIVIAEPHQPLVLGHVHEGDACGRGKEASPVLARQPKSSREQAKFKVLNEFSVSRSSGTAIEGICAQK